MSSNINDKENFRLAVSLQNSGDLEGAYAIYRKLFPRYKTIPDLLVRMALAAVGLHKYKQASKLAFRVLKIRPDAGVAHNILGAAAMHDKDLPTAITYFQDYVKCAPNDVNARSNLAIVLNMVNRGKEAAQHQLRACELAPNLAKAHYDYGVTLLSLGHLEEAGERFRKALALDGAYAGAWKKLSELGELNLEKDLPKLNKALNSLKGQNEQQAKVHFALAELYEKEKDFDHAFDQFELGNEKVCETLNYDVADDENMMKGIASSFQPKLFERLAGRGLESDNIIFIVGMPRSGTTLVEQLLGGHSQVYAAGELSFLQDAIFEKGERGEQGFPHSATRWKQKDVQAIGKNYLNSIEALQPDAPFVVEKSINNFLYLGAIRVIFPQARIIHCTRNPIDTCLGNYRQMFTNGQNFSYALADLVRYYKAYEKLMAHWHSLFGDAILDVSYEHLVQNTPQDASEIVAHCGLDWEESCIDIANTSRGIRTASATQIREGIHTQYLERWRNYEAHIQPLLEGLKDA